MKLKKTFSFSDKNQIWRLVISETDKLVIETRNTDKKEVFFHAVDLTKGKKHFKNLQLDAKYWIGIESVYGNIIFFHLFAKPDMPDHQGIIAYDIIDRKILWQNDDYFFLAVHNNKVFAAKKKYEGQDYFTLDFKTGEFIEELDKNNAELNFIINSQDDKFADYTYPQKSSEVNDNTVLDLIAKETNEQNIVEDVEFIRFNNILMFNYYLKFSNNLLDNVFVVYDIEKGKKVLSEVVNKNLNSISPDTFFCYKNMLFLLKNKNKLLVFKII